MYLFWRGLYMFRRMSDIRCRYSQEVETAVNKQIKVEQQAAQNYLSMAVCFLHPCVSRPGTGGCFMRMYKEELSHMNKLIDYQLLRGGKPLINGLQPPNQIEKNCVLYAFEIAYKMETSVTELLEKLVHTAEKMKDYECAHFVIKLLEEQMQSLNEMSHHVTKISRLKNDEHGVYHYDLELAKLYPYKISSY